LVSCLTVAGSAPFCGPKTSAARSNGCAHVAQADDLRAAQPPASSIASMAPAAPSVVALPPQATRTTCAPSATGRGDELAGPSRGRGHASRSSGATRARPLARAISMTGRAAVLEQRVGGLDLAPERSCTGGRRRSRPPSAVSSTSMVPSPPSATGHRSGGASPADSSPRPMAAATSVARKVPLNESGATSTGGRSCFGQPWLPRRSTRRSRSAGLELRVSSPSKVYFPGPGWTKLDLVHYYLETAEGTVRGLYDRPTVLKRWKDGITGEVFFQKRVPEKRPEWLQTATVHFPSGRSATELVPNDAAHLIWGVNLGNIDWNPWPVRRSDLDHPDELRIDLDPQPAVEWSEVRAVALCAGDGPARARDARLPKTSGSRGIHVNVRIEPRWSFTEVRRAALALAREVERRMPGRATTAVVEGGAHGVFLDYNQNARDRTVASQYSVRRCPTRRSRARCAGTRSPTSSPRTCAGHRARAPARGRRRQRDIDDVHHSLDALLDLAAATRRRASATRRGRRTSPSRRASPSGCSRAARAARTRPRPARRTARRACARNGGGPRGSLRSVPKKQR
jgi:DNA ligase D-like protein (predicted polymerase)